MISNPFARKILQFSNGSPTWRPLQRLDYRRGLPCVGFATEDSAAAGVYGDDFAVFQGIGSMGSADDGRDAEGDGDDSRFASEAGFFETMALARFM